MAELRMALFLVPFLRAMTYESETHSDRFEIQ